MLNPFSKPGRSLLLVLLATGLLAGCGKKTETEQLAAMRGSFVYKRYRQVSEPGLPGMLAAYEKGTALAGHAQPAPLTAQDLCIARLLLAYSALAGNKAMIAIAETDIVEAGGCQPFDRMAATSLRAVAFHRQEWPGLADEESRRALQASTGLESGKHSGPEQLILMHLTLGYLAVTEKRWDRMQIHVDALALLLEQPWLTHLSVAGVAFQEKRIQDGLVAIKQLSLDPTTPEPIQREAMAFIAHVEAQAGDVDAFAFMPRLIAASLWEAGKRKGPAAMTGTMRFIDEQALQPLNDSVKGGMEGARGLLDRWRGTQGGDAMSDDNPGDAQPAG